MKFEMIGGGTHHEPIRPADYKSASHVLPPPATTMYVRGDTLESDEPLHEKWPDKFKLLPEPKAAAAVTAPDDDEVEEEGEAPGVVDVTPEFAEAAALVDGCRVLKEGKVYHVEVKGEVKSESLSSKAKVKDALKKLAKEQ